MPDREKVIKGLEMCSSPYVRCGECPYRGTSDDASSCQTIMQREAVELLKARRTAGAAEQPKNDRMMVMSWLEGLTFDDWEYYHSANEVQNIAKCALELLKNGEKKRLRVYITATSGEENYPTICGKHEFDSLEEARDFAYYGARGITGKGCNLIIMHVTDQEDSDIDDVIEIYDDYREM